MMDKAEKPLSIHKKVMHKCVFIVFIFIVVVSIKWCNRFKSCAAWFLHWVMNNFGTATFLNGFFPHMQLQMLPRNCRFPIPSWLKSSLLSVLRNLRLVFSLCNTINLSGHFHSRKCETNIINCGFVVWFVCFAHIPSHQTSIIIAELYQYYLTMF